MPGDSWQPFWFETQVGCPDHAWLVVDTSTTVVSGIPLRTLSVVLTVLGEPTGETRMIRERIGGTGGHNVPDLPPPLCGPVIECYCTLGCYQDQDIIPQGGPCALPLGVVERADPGLVIHPVPAIGTLTISVSSHTRLESIDLIAMDGHRVLSLAQGIGPTTTLDVQQLPNGIYMVHARTGNGLYFAKPVVISR